MYYLNSRYYNPEWGRFINADGLIGQTGQLLGHNMFAYCGNNPVNMADPSGYMYYCPVWAESNKAASDQYFSDYNAAHGSSSGVTKILNIAVDAVNSKRGQAISSFLDNSIGNSIQKAAKQNKINAWKSTPLPTLAMRKMGEESRLLQKSASFVKKGGGLLSVVSLGLNGWDDFSNHGLINGGKRFAVDVMSTLAGVIIGGLTAGLPGGIVWGTALSIGINTKYFDPWKNSID